jgi:hypothetical protein
MTTNNHTTMLRRTGLGLLLFVVSFIFVSSFASQPVSASDITIPLAESAAQMQATDNRPIFEYSFSGNKQVQNQHRSLCGKAKVKALCRLAFAATFPVAVAVAETHIIHITSRIFSLRPDYYNFLFRYTPF